MMCSMTTALRNQIDMLPSGGVRLHARWWRPSWSSHLAD